MPVIETMNLDFGGELGVRQERVFNVEAAVGAGAPNRIGDVMLIQAMFREMSLLFTYEFHYAKVPEVTGRIDKNTIDSIWSVQRAWSMFLLAVDGRIDPAALAGRNLRLKAEKYTMIQMLARYVPQSMSAKRKIEDPIEGLLNLYPQLRKHIRDKTKASAAAN